MVRGQLTCRCCNSGALTKPILGVIQELEELLPRHYDLIITSGYRCLRNNAACGGSPRSQHLIGNAVDCYCDSLDVLGFYAVCRHLDGFEKLGLGIYETEKGYYLHIDTRTTGKARWHYINGEKIEHEDSWILQI